MEELNGKILLVEDDLSHASLLMRWLESSGKHSVTHVSDGRAGVNMALHGEWDLIISDIDLPDIDGLELGRQSKLCNQMVPVLLITAHEGMDYPLKALQNKVDDFLIKPFDKSVLAEKAAALIKSFRSERQKKQTRVLAIGVGPEDIELGCGGTLLRHQAEGDNINILILSASENDEERLREVEEIQQIADVLKAKMLIGGLSGRNVSDNAEAFAFISDVVTHFQPDVVYTHSEHDSHQDHRNIHVATIDAAAKVPTVYCYQSPSSTIKFQPSVFVDISEFLPGKIGLLAKRGADASVRPYLNEDNIRSTARYWGRFANYCEAEPMEVVKALA